MEIEFKNFLVRQFVMLIPKCRHAWHNLYITIKTTKSVKIYIIHTNHLQVGGKVKTNLTQYKRQTFTINWKWIDVDACKMKENSPETRVKQKV